MLFKILGLMMGSIVKNNDIFYLLFQQTFYLIDCDNCNNKTNNCYLPKDQNLKYQALIPMIKQNKCSFKKVPREGINIYGKFNFNDYTLRHFKITEKELFIKVELLSN